MNIHHEGQLCPRDVSRNAKAILEKEVYRRIKIKPDELPDDCQLNPNFDRYYDQELNKKHRRSKGEFQCNYCGKRFVNEFYIDRHMDNKHRDKLQPNRTTCFADLCPIIGCSTKSSSQDRNSHYKSNRGRYASLAPSFHNLELCSEKEVETNKFLCEGLIRRCFSGIPEGAGVGDYFRTHYCNALHCENGILVGAHTGSAAGHGSFFIVHFVQILIVCIIIAFMIIYVTAVGSWRRLLGFRTDIRSPLERSSIRRLLNFQTNSSNTTKKKLL